MLNKKLILIIVLLYIIIIGLSYKIYNGNSIKPLKDIATNEKIDASNKNVKPENNLPLHKIKLPPGFKIKIFAENVENVRSLTVSPNGYIYAGTRFEDKVYALIDSDGDWVVDKKHIIARNLKMPNGVAFYKGDLYISALDKILKLKNIDQNVSNPPKPIVVFDKFPDEEWHGKKYIAFGPDNKLYVPVGAPCNVCEKKEPIFSSITRMNPDGSGFEIFSHGIRESVGFDFHPVTKELWFSSNGRDNMGDNIPPDEINHAPIKGLHFGFPYCHAGDIPDPEFGKKRECDEFTKPALKLQAHVAPLGVKFYKGNQFPAKFKNQLFVAEHGSWNRSKKVGYKIMLAEFKDNKIIKYSPFASGWLNDKTQTAWGRPTSLLELSDGSLLISDDHANVIYRISYEK